MKKKWTGHRCAPGVRGALHGRARAQPPKRRGARELAAPNPAGGERAADTGLQGDRERATKEWRA
eukprot:8485725-Alexandrium_andersonii.AAC.1